MGATTTDEITLQDITRTLRRRRLLVLVIFSACVLLAGMYCLVSSPRYEAEGTLEVLQNSPDALDLQGLNGSTAAATDALQANIDLQTQANVLQSDTLAIATIRALHLENTREFRKGASGSEPQPSQANAGPKNAFAADSGYSPKDLGRYLQIFKKRLKVSPVGGTRLISVTYLNADPKLAADVVNTLMKGLVDYTFQTKVNATSQTSSWLGGQLADLRRQSQALQSKVVDLQRQTGVYSLGATDAQGHEQAYSGVLERLQASDTALAQAEQNRILRGAIAHAVESGNPEAISSLAGNSASQMNGMLVLQTLREQEATQQAALVQAQSKYGPAYPLVEQLKANIAGLNKTIAEETERVRSRARSDYDIAVQTESGYRQRYQADRNNAATVNDKAVEFAIVKQEADQSRQLYEDLLKRFKEADVLGGLRLSNILVVDPARPPLRIKEPNKLLILGASLGVGLLLGCVAAFLIDLLDTRLYTPDDVRQATSGADVLVVPYASRLNGSSSAQSSHGEASRNTFLEAIRRFLPMLHLSAGQQKLQVVLITSPEFEEGAHTFADTLAAVLAQGGNRTLLLRAYPEQANSAVGRRNGLHADTTAGEQRLPRLVQSAAHPNLDVLAVDDQGAFEDLILHPRAYVAALESWRNSYDLILILAAPVLTFSDAAILAPSSDLTLLLARERFTEKAALGASVDTLTQTAPRHTLKVVLLSAPQQTSY